MSTIAAVSGAHRHGPAGGMSPAQMDKVMAPVADKLGMSGEELKAQLKSGKTLNDIATSKGVSHEDLVAAVKKGLDDNKAAGAKGDTAKMADAIASGRGPRGPHRAKPSGGSDPDGDGDDDGGKAEAAGRAKATAESKTLEALAALLKLSKDELASKLTNGAQVSQLAKDQGVSSDKVADLLVKGLNVDTYA